METKNICDNYPKQAFGSELDPKALFINVRSSNEVPSSASSILELVNTYGAAVVQFEDEETPAKQLLCFKQLFGDTVGHDRSDGDGIAEIAATNESSGYLGTSSREHYFHTDGSFEENPPQIILLRCEIPAQKGGISQLVSGKRLHDWLGSIDKKALEALYQNDALSVSRVGKSFSGAVFRQYSQDRVAIRYRADETVRSSGSEDMKRAIGLVQDFLSDEKNKVSFQLQARQVLILDNLVTLHARTSFDPGDPRKMHRLWFTGVPSVDVGLCLGFKASI